MTIPVPQSVNTELYLCKNVIVDPSYNHVYDFNSYSEQLRYFTSPWNSGGKAFYIFNGDDGYYSKLTFQRIGDTFRVPIPREMLEENGINYLVFRNKRYDSVTQKWYDKYYFCFISFMDYINENLTSISYSIDLYQTYQFDFIMRPCFVEREMINVSDDVAGANIVTEDIGYGEYIQNYIEPDSSNIDISFPNDEWNIVLATTYKRDFTPVNDQSSTKGVFNYFGVASGLAYLVFDDTEELSRWIINCTAQNQSTGIQAAYAVPKAICGSLDLDHDILPNGSKLQALKGYADFEIPDSVDGYTPINKKVLTYPYNMLFLTNNNSSSKIYKWEYFKETYRNCVRFFLFGVPVMPIEIGLIPFKYNGSGPDGFNMWERLVMTDVPICSFDIDVFRAYMAANKWKIGIQAVEKVVETTAKFGMGLIAGRKKITGGSTTTIKDTIVRNKIDKNGGETPYNRAERNISKEKTNYVNRTPSDYGIDSFNSLLNITGSLLDINSKPPEAFGETTNILNMASSMAGFNAYQTCVRHEYAKIIDDYFSKFGYACHEIKQPNLNNRVHWNYIKTCDCIILPKSDANALNTLEIMGLQSIFDNGVTIWHCLKNSNGNLSGESDFGNYSNNNH